MERGPQQRSRPRQFHIRRIVPYLIVAVGGFALASLIVVLVILPPSPTSRTTNSADTPQATLPVIAAPSPPPSARPLMDTAAGSLADSLRTPPVFVPDVTQMTLEDARLKLIGLGFVVNVTHDTSSFDPPNTVLRQSPSAGAQAPARSTITLTASEFPPER